MSDEGLFLAETHPLSKRTAVLEDDGFSAWLYLTEPASEQIARDAWVYNCIEPPEELAEEFRNGPPPATKEYADQGAVFKNPLASSWSFMWDARGESVAVLCDGSVMAAILAKAERGYSRHLKKQGPWGLPMTEDIIISLQTG